MATLPDNAKALIDKHEYATIATIEPDGQPHLSIVWVARDGDDLLVSTTTNRRKYANLARDPRATVCVYDRANPFAYLEVRGDVEMTEEGGRELIDQLARDYVGAERYTMDDGTDNVRTVLRVKPRKVVFSG
ncbi:MAG: PPOX class F420-dependent oxidoreductase [Motilibacteraceae bacterium]